MAAVQQSVESHTKDRRAILKELLLIMDFYDQTQHDEVKDKLKKNLIHYFDLLISQQKDGADVIERADLFLSDLEQEIDLCLKICSDDSDRGKKILSIYDGYEEAKDTDLQGLLGQALTEAWGGIPTIAIRQQNKNMARKEMPDKLKALVEKVLTEIEHSPKNNQTQYEKSFNSILMDILNNVSDAKKQSECEAQLIALSTEVMQEIHAQNERMAKKIPERINALVERVMREIEHSPKQKQSHYELSFNSILMDILNKTDVDMCESQLKQLSARIIHDIHQENVTMLATMGVDNLVSVPNLKKLFSTIKERPAEQQSECAIKFKGLLAKPSNSAQAYKLQKEEIDRAIANEKSKRFLRRVAIVGVGAVATVGLAALSFFTFGAALPHALFLGGLGLTAMIRASEYNDQKSDQKLQQLSLKKRNLINERDAAIAEVSDKCTKFVDSLDNNIHKQEQPPQVNERSSLTMFPKAKRAIYSSLGSNYNSNEPEGLRQK